MLLSRMMPVENRCALDDWRGVNTFSFYLETQPIQQADGTYSQPSRLPTDGWKFSGLLYRYEYMRRFPLNAPIQNPLAFAGAPIAGDDVGAFEVYATRDQTAGLDTQSEDSPVPLYVLRTMAEDPLGNRGTVSFTPVRVL